MKKRHFLLACILFLSLAGVCLADTPAAGDQEGFPGGYTKERYLTDKAKAEKGDAGAQFVMGYLYHRQVVDFVKADSAKAFSWYQKAALQGHLQACQILGLMYQKGDGTKADPEAAKRSYQYAADRGLAEARYGLGLLYAEGLGVPRDEELAIFWFKKADRQNFSPASVALGVMYAGGRGVSKDLEAAFNWFVRSAELGNSEGMLRVAGMYRTGIGVPQDIGIAIRWLEEALKVKTRSSLLATNDLAWILATCPDTTYRDSKRALELAEFLVKSGATQPSALDTLAAAYAANGLYEKAIHVQEDAIRKLDETGEVQLEAALKERLALYKAGKPWIDTEKTVSPAKKQGTAQK
ncbi:tetratricopeptide repeat protein [Desulfoluna spongiiphila]|uniref:Sel1 repeat-containing protein n=1 Tax=Desulfoluna spongiiphila TaxID=419481 RepID=A0A1G5H1A5_9BACT|nr:tetratricopeptide repeat protein [Desulfoluna spongiiphila]SCY57635.1 Sel1 repeat-containing protein [Desulfoluna spongiiphila]VVS94723.1 sel1-like repeat [Desulfoluna spongiiphila]